MSALEGWRIVLGVTGSIAVYKVVELARRWTQGGAEVNVVMTPSAREFVTPLTFQALTHRPVLASMFGVEENAAGHVALGASADAVVIAPATAHVIAKLAHGFADDLICTTVLATPAPVIVAPAMETHMYSNPATQQNLNTLRERGVTIVEPEAGELASGAVGMGRLASLERIDAALMSALGTGALGAAALVAGSLSGRRVLVTAGPTHEAIDPVRYISNRSSGKMGYAIAAAARRAGADVTLVSGPTALRAPDGVDVVPVTTASEMREAVLRSLPTADAVVMAAAVADYRVADAPSLKLKKTGKPLEIRLEENPDILSEIVRRRRDGAFVVGFKAETGDPVPAAQEMLKQKRPDVVVANDVRAAFGSDTNEVALVWADGVERLSLMTKDALADHLVAILSERLPARP